MSSNTLLFWIFTVRFAWVAAVLGVTTYLVFWKDASGWWFLLALLLCGGSTTIKDDK